MVATSGDRLLDEDAISALGDLLVNHAFLVTPNLPEAALLTCRDIDTPDDMKRAADTLMNAGANAALIKGGHGSGNVVTDLLALQSGFELFEHERFETRNTHRHGLHAGLGDCRTNCRAECGRYFSDFVPDLRAATEHGLAYVHSAIKNAPNFGLGNGPLEHVRSNIWQSPLP